MGSINFADLMEQASAEGFGGEILPDGPYTVEVASTNAGKSQGGKEQIGVRLKVVGGPHDGKSFWDNLTISPENPKALAIFFRQVAAYGVSLDFVKQAGTTESIAAAIPTGSRFDVTLGHRDFNGKTYQDVKKVAPATGALAAAPQVAAPFAPAVVAQAAVPQPVAAGAPPF